ncbi:hypothetical protein [Brevibacillus daliensis]|uniref:hypothetical protein n=1 Tax=Brevibacillus daliensis TaxID=2892995 RepID=UPI001E4C6303|nr:hypothetical protein [Brevibacillus daliensis]
MGKFQSHKSVSSQMPRNGVNNQRSCTSTTKLNRKLRPVREQRCDGLFVNGDCCIPLIAPPQNLIHLRLAGLDKNINFNLIRHKNSSVKIYYLCDEKVRKIKGTVCDVGTDFVDVANKDSDKVTTIFQSRIVKIKRYKH